MSLFSAVDASDVCAVRCSTRSPEAPRPCVRVELVYFTGCPNVEPMRELLAECLVRLGGHSEIVEINTDTAASADRYRRFASPTVLVDGVDVLGGAAVGAVSCRLRLPTEQELLSALRGGDDQ
jgi:hypothetical protein